MGDAHAADGVVAILDSKLLGGLEGLVQRLDCIRWPAQIDIVVLSQNQTLAQEYSILIQHARGGVRIHRLLGNLSRFLNGLKSPFQIALRAQRAGEQT